MVKLVHKMVLIGSVKSVRCVLFGLFGVSAGEQRARARKFAEKKNELRVRRISLNIDVTAM